MNRYAFRVWDTEEKRMWSWNEILGVTVGTYKLEKMKVGELFRSGRYIVMQWTGEKDKNRNYIYEEDFVIEKENEGIKYRVFYDPGCAGYETEPEGETILNIRPGMNPGTTKHLIIQGNMYETYFKETDGEAEWKMKKYEQARAAMIRLAFRAWDEKEKKMIPWKGLFELSVYDLFQSGRYDVMQWTGTMDNRNKFIFEGDILQKGMSGKHKYIAYWANCIPGFWTWALITDEHERPELGADRRTGSIFVIGNTYENPDEAKYNTLEEIYKGSWEEP